MSKFTRKLEERLTTDGKADYKTFDFPQILHPEDTEGIPRTLGQPQTPSPSTPKKREETLTTSFHSATRYESSAEVKKVEKNPRRIFHVTHKPHGKK